MAYRRLAPSRLPDGRTYEEHIYRTASSDDLAVVELRTAGLRGHGELLVAEAVVVRGGAFKTGRLSSSRFVPSPVFKEWLDSHHRNFRPTGPPAALTPEGPFRFE